MPSTNTDPRPAAAPMTHVWEGRRRSAANERARKAMAELEQQGYVVTLDRPIPTR